MSFTVEAGAEEGAFHSGTVGVLNDTAFDIAPDGSFEVTVGGPPMDRGWLPLAADASRITVRHYWEQVTPRAKPPAAHLALSIELIDGTVPESPPAPTDASVAASIRRMATYVRSRIESMAEPGGGDAPAFVSRIPHEFPPPVPPGDHALAAADAAYSMAPCLLGPDEALATRALAGVPLRERVAVDASSRPSTTCATRSASTGPRPRSTTTAPCAWSSPTGTPACPTGSPRRGAPFDSLA